jgi:hypothetical protein
MKVKGPQVVRFDSQLCNFGGDSHWQNVIIYGRCEGHHDGKPMGVPENVNSNVIPF